MQDSNRLIHLQRVTCYHYTNVLCGRLRVLFLCLLAETSRPWGLASPQSCVLLTPSSASCPMVQAPHGFIRIGWPAINEEKAGFVAFQALTFRCFVCPKPVQQLGTQEMILTDCLISANEESNHCGPGRTWTCDRRMMNSPLWPAKLRVRVERCSHEFRSDMKY